MRGLAAARAGGCAGATAGGVAGSDATGSAASDHPEVVLELLRAVHGVDHRGAIELVRSPENLTQLQPAERRADAVLVVRTPDGHPRIALVVEVQLQADPEKRHAWPAYVAVLRARLDCLVSLVVVTLDDATAHWCARPIELDDHGSVVCPRVIGPSQVPRVDTATARRYPELGVVSVIAHGDEPDAADIGRATLDACLSLDDERRELYTEVVLSYLNEAARRALEAEMSFERMETRSKYLREQWDRAEAKGREEGEAKGREEGAARGRAEALAALGGAVLEVLAARGIAVNQDQRATVLASTDPAELRRWLVRAATVERTDDLFAG